MTKKCPKCGEINLNDAISCDTCGASLIYVRPSGAQTTTVCPSCGATNPKEAATCGSCGKNFADMTAAIRKRNKTLLAIEISVVVIALVLFALFVPYNHADLEVTVHSTNATETLHYYIYVNGQQRGEGDLPPGYQTVWTIECGWSNTGSNVMNVTASTGSGPGSVQDSKTVSVSAGGYYRISLSV